MPSKLQMLIDLALQQKGAYGAKRVQRAADEIPNLEKRYTEGALRDAFLGDNAKAVVTMPPGKFEKYAEPLPFSTEEQRQKYIQYLSTLKGFEDVPFLEINKAPKSNKTIISGHEGRHRSRALEALGDEQSLVRIMPRAALREPLPRRSQEEYIEALRKEIGERPLVIPEGGGSAIELPDIYKDGGPVHMADAGSVDEAIRAAMGKAPVGGRIIQSKASDVEQAFRDKLAREQAEREQAVKAGLASAITEIPGFAADVAVDLPYYLAQKAAGRTPKPLAFGETVRGAVGRAIGAYPPEREQAELSKPSQYGNITDALSILSSIATGGPQAAAYRAAGKAGRVMGKEGLRAIDEAMQTGQGPLAGGLAAIMPRRIDVYHGSPHRFASTERNPLGEFDPSKIGTGEGAQSYGYGHYLAENPKTANMYASYLSKKSPYEADKILQDAYKESLGGDGKNARKYIENLIAERQAAAKESLDMDGVSSVDDLTGLSKRTFIQDFQQPLDDALEALEMYDNAKPPYGTGLYKVDLPDEQIARMLDWDKPLSEQPESVRKALSNFDTYMRGKWPARVLPEDPEDSGGSLLSILSRPSMWDKLQPEVRERMNELWRQTDDPSVAASLYLKERGIPGIKYLDASSRGAGEGTRNFVIFPGGEELLTIKERMKKGGPVSQDAMNIAAMNGKITKKKIGKVTKKAVGGAMSAAQKAARAFVEARKAKGMPEYHQDWQKALQRGETPPAAPATKEQLDAEMQRLLETDKYKEMNRGGKVTNFGKKKKTITIDAMQMAVADKKLKGKKHG